MVQHAHTSVITNIRPSKPSVMTNKRMPTSSRAAPSAVECVFLSQPLTQRHRPPQHYTCCRQSTYTQHLLSQPPLLPLLGSVSIGNHCHHLRTRHTHISIIRTYEICITSGASGTIALYTAQFGVAPSRLAGSGRNPPHGWVQGV